MMTGANGDDRRARQPRARGDTPSPILEMFGVEKRFGSTVALAGVDLGVLRGEVHALIGENGAGKSTLMKILSGAHQADSGSIRLDGVPFAPRNPEEGRRAGVGMIYQELNLAPHLSVEANILLGIEESRWGVVRHGNHLRRVREALEILGHGDIEPHTPVGRLGVAAQQLVEVARALVTDARIIVFDEPTSSLSLQDTERLFQVIRRLQDRQVSIIYISHFLEEVFRVADRFTVLRNGDTVGSGGLADARIEEIIEMMVGRSLTELFPKVPHERGEPLLTLENLHGVSLPQGADLTLHRGEILGIAGLVGAGRTEMLRAIYGLDAVRDGRVTIAQIASGYWRPEQRVRQGVGFLSENRKEEGLALLRSVGDNVILSNLRAVSRWGWVLPSRQRRRVAEWIERLRVRCKGTSEPVGDLSGGNQQKVAFARLLHQQADILLLDEPTRGIDVGSKVEVYKLMGELAAEGKAVLFVSSYIPELLGVCDRIAVMYRGRLSAVREAARWTEHSILLFATGGEQAA